MTNIRHFDKEEYAAKALELFERNREAYVRFAYECLNDGATPEYARKRLADRVENHVGQALFNYLIRTESIQGSIRHDFTLGFCRIKRAEPRMSDVPSGLLSISEILMKSETHPKFADVIDSVLMDARKLIMIAAIETTTSEASSRAQGGNENG